MIPIPLYMFVVAVCVWSIVYHLVQICDNPSDTPEHKAFRTLLCVLYSSLLTAFSTYLVTVSLKP